MDSDACKICGNELFIKSISLDSYEYFCPSCLNLNPIDKIEAHKLCKKYLELSKQKSLVDCQRFSTKDLIYVSLSLREMAIKEQPDVINIKPQEIIWATLILKDCLKNSFSRQETSVKENLSQLFFNYREIITAENFLILVQEDYFSLFEDTLELRKLIPDGQVIIIDEKQYRMIASRKWRDFIEASETIQLVPNIRSEKMKKIVDNKVRERQKRIKEKEYKLERAKVKTGRKLQQEILQLKESFRTETMELLYNSFHAVYYNEVFFMFSEIEREDKILDFIDLIRTISEEKLKYVQHNPQQIKNYYEMTLGEFEALCNSKSLDFNKMYLMLISSKTDCKEFPLLVEYESKILVCPQMLLLISSFIRFGFAKEDYKSKLGFLGDDFEDKVVELFESQNFILDHPTDRRRRLVRIKIKSINREIDLLPYNDKYLFVVDCKRNSLKPKYIFDYERKSRAFGNEGIKDEIDGKHLTRVQYFENSQEEFGFKSKRIVKGLIVTLIKEDIENYNGIDIVPFFDLQEYIRSYIN